MNKFKKLDAPNSDMVSVTIWKDGNQMVAEAIGPTRTGGEEISTDVWIGPPMPVPDVLNRAIDLSEKHNRKIGVVDPQNLWQAEWGELL